MEYLFLGLGIGAILAYFVFLRLNKQKHDSRADEQSVILMDKIKSVCKFITVEGDFSEIYHYENLKEKYVSLLLGKKNPSPIFPVRAIYLFFLYISIPLLDKLRLSGIVPWAKIWIPLPD